MVHYDFPGFQMTLFGRVQPISQATRDRRRVEDAVLSKISCSSRKLSIWEDWNNPDALIFGVNISQWDRSNRLNRSKRTRLISASSSGWFDCQGCPKISLKHSATRPGQWPANMAMGVVKISNPRIVWKPPTSSIWQHLLLQSCSDPPFFWFDPHFLLGSSWEAPRLLVLPQRGDQCHVLGVVWELNQLLMSSPRGSTPSGKKIDEFDLEYTESWQYSRIHQWYPWCQTCVCVCTIHQFFF